MHHGVGDAVAGSTAARMASASSSVTAIGFSETIAFPASAAAIACAACKAWGVAITTVSTGARASRSR